jgi:hypothetical protein
MRLGKHRGDDDVHVHNLELGGTLRHGFPEGHPGNVAVEPRSLREDSHPIPEGYEADHHERRRAEVSRRHEAKDEEY